MLCEIFQANLNFGIYVVFTNYFLVFLAI